MKIFNILFLCFFFCFYSISPAFAEKNLNLEQQNIEETARNLVKGIKKPLKQAEVLAIFIAEHYERDGFLKKEKDNAGRKNKTYTPPYQSNLFENKVGDSYAFAELYNQMCLSVGLESVIIEGYAGHRIESYGVNRKEQKAIKEAFHTLTGKKDFSLERYKSAWNAVKINEKWILVDTYWMIRGKNYVHKEVQSERRMKRILEQNKSKKLKKHNFSIDMDFFDAKPKEFIKTHFPFNEQYQFLKHPYSLNKFLTQ